MYETQKKLFDYYVNNQVDFIAQYNGKSIILKDYQVVGIYDSDWEAARYAIKNFPIGSFIVQRVSPGTKDYTVEIFSERNKPHD